MAGGLSNCRRSPAGRGGDPVRLLTPKEAAERAKVSRSLIYRWCDERRLPHIRVRFHRENRAPMIEQHARQYPGAGADVCDARARIQPAFARQQLDDLRRVTRPKTRVVLGPPREPLDRAKHWQLPARRWPLPRTAPAPEAPKPRPPSTAIGSPALPVPLMPPLVARWAKSFNLSCRPA